jgi:hypothetical protein
MDPLSTNAEVRQPSNVSYFDKKKTNGISNLFKNRVHPEQIYLDDYSGRQKLDRNLSQNKLSF